MEYDLLHTEVKSSVFIGQWHCSIFSVVLHAPKLNQIA